MYDVIIVGSGTSGGVISYYLSKAGIKCLLVEAGEAFTKEDFPKGELNYNAELFWNGGLDINTDAKLAFLRGKGLGGGSLINQALFDRFDETVFSEWKQISGVDFLSTKSMARHYDEIQKMLSIKEVPKEERNKNAEIFINGFDKLGLKWAPLERGYDDCAIDRGNDCIACLGGCHRDSKQSMLVTFIAEAKKLGLEVKTDFMADLITEEGSSIKVKGFTREKNPKKGKDEPLFVKTYETLEAKKIVVASGSLGTTQLLLKSGFKQKLPRLGDGFYCHPQVMNFALFDDEPVNAHKGAFQSVKSDDPTMKERNFKLENVFALPIGIALLYPGHGKKHQEWMSKYKYMACIEIAIKDRTKGRIELDKNGRLKIKKKLNEIEQNAQKEGIKVVNDIFTSYGAKEIFNATQLFGLHLMGGCSIGTDKRSSVVNEHFRLHDHENIYVADSSIFVKAPGINPALSIMAFSHRASESIIHDIQGGY